MEPTTANPSRDLSKAWEVWRRVYNLGFNLVPVADESKKTIWTWGPNDEGKPNWQQGRQSVRFFWEMYHSKKTMKNIAMITGERSGVVCVDADNDEALAIVKARCPDTPMMTKTSRGLHLFYRHPGGERIQQVLGVVLDGKQTKIDIKADGNYVLAPGSAGKTWVTPWTKEMMDAVPIFDRSWLPHEGALKKNCKTNEACDDGEFNDHDEFVESDWLPPVGERIEKARRYIANVPGRTKGDGADNAAYLLALKLVWGFALPEDDAIDLLQQWGERSDQVDEGGRPYPWTPEGNPTQDHRCDQGHIPGHSRRQASRQERSYRMGDRAIQRSLPES